MPIIGGTSEDKTKVTRSVLWSEHGESCAQSFRSEQLEAFTRREMVRRSAHVARVGRRGPEAEDVIAALLSVLETVIGHECIWLPWREWLPHGVTPWG
jgi:hypothetical protein